MRLRRGVPVLDRGDGSVQVGVARPAILTGLDAAERRVVATWEARLTGWRPAGADTAALKAAEALLDGRGFGQGHDAASPRSGRGGDGGAGEGLGVVRVRGQGRVAREIAVMAARAGARAVRLQASNDPAAADSTAFAAHRDVSVLAAGTRIASPFERAHVEIHVAPAAPSPTWAVDLMSSDTPHVLVSWDDEQVVVGPAVVPGTSACARCVALAAAEADPAWPRIVLQLADPGRLPAPSVAVAGAAAALAVRLAAEAGACAGRADDGPAEAAEARLLNRRWAVRLDDAEPAPAPIAPAEPHSACGCGSAAPAPDTIAMISGP